MKSIVINSLLAAWLLAPALATPPHDDHLIALRSLAKRKVFERRQENVVASHGGIGLSLVSTGVVEATAVTPVGGALAAGETTAAASGSSTDPSSSVDTSSSTTSSDSAVATSTTSSGEGEATATSTSSASEGATTSSSEIKGSSTSSSAGASETKASSSSTSASNVDLVVLNLALTLENLEAQFYSKALSTFPVSAMVAAGLSQTQAQIITEQVQAIQKDEATHASAITDAIKAGGGTPFNGCSFNFDGALADPITFLAVARSLEQVGVSAYLGAASLLSDKAILTAAGSILTLEARHQSLLNTFNGGTFNPQSFDIALGPEQVLALAGGFLQGCQASDLSLTTNQPLAVTDAQSGTTRFQIGSQLAFASTLDLASQASSLSCHMIVGGAATALVFDASKCVVPNGINGPVAVFITNSSTPLQTNLQTQNKATILAGPALLFVDSSANTLSSLFAVQNVKNNNAKGQRQNNQNDYSVASADLGGFYIGMKQNGNTRTVTVVKQTVTTTTQTVIVSDSTNNNKNNGKNNENGKNQQQGQSQKGNVKKPSRMGRHRRRSGPNRQERDIGNLREIGWSMV
ncbi:hypothetical protein T439DRAFT_380141 [Meredithblackwellia eburnea MCA 4105]